MPSDATDIRTSNRSRPGLLLLAAAAALTILVVVILAALFSMPHHNHTSTVTPSGPAGISGHVMHHHPSMMGTTHGWRMGEEWMMGGAPWIAGRR